MARASTAGWVLPSIAHGVTDTVIGCSYRYAGRCRTSRMPLPDPARKRMVELPAESVHQRDVADSD